jgi:3-hydroxyacyl-[acyl-carrier-protein] dehydratase
MPPPLILDPDELDLFGPPLAGRDEILRAIPQRYEFQLLDAVVLIDAQRNVFAGYLDLRPDAWWTRGHIPGRPLFPGALMIEAAAQLASVVRSRMLGETGFLGFVGVDAVKFRGGVIPPTRLVLIGRSIEMKRRRTISALQGFVERDMVFEGTITGMIL